MKKYLLLFLCITVWLGVLVGLRGFAAAEASVPAGSVRVRTESGMLELDLEEYVAALLSAAMPENYPEEALRAQAVILRTQTRRALESGVPHEDGAFCAGCESCFPFSAQVTAASRDAARATAGEVLRYDGALIDARFHLLVLRIHRLRVRAFGRGHSLPRKRGHAGRKRLFRLCQHGDDPASTGWPPRSPTARCPLRKATCISLITTAAGSKTFFSATPQSRAARWRRRSRFGSQRFDAVICDGALVVTTYGYGDGLGLSQYGAYLLAKNGQTYKDILLHYYRGAEISAI